MYRSTIAVNLLSASLIFGALGTGCVPTTPSEFAKFDTKSYTAAFNKDNFDGTWVFTINNEYSNKHDPYAGMPDTYYSRSVARISPAEDGGGANITYCQQLEASGMRVVRHDIVGYDNNMIEIHTSILPVPPRPGYETWVEFNKQSDGTLIGTLDTEAYTLTIRGVRVSLNQSLTIGTIKLDSFTDSNPAFSKPVVCLNEAHEEMTSSDGDLIKKDWIIAGGEDDEDWNAFVRIVDWTGSLTVSFLMNTGPVEIGDLMAIPLTEEQTFSSETRTVKGYMPYGWKSPRQLLGEGKVDIKL